MPLSCVPLLIVLAGGIPALALLGTVPGVVGVVVAQAVFLGAWAQLPVPSARRGAVLAGLTAAAADAVLLRTAAGAPLEALAPVLGVAMVAVFAVQLARRDGRAHVTMAAAAAMSGALLAVAGAAWLVAVTEAPGHVPLLLIAGGAVALGALVACLPALTAAWRCVAAGVLALGAAVGAAQGENVLAAAALATGVAVTTAAALSLVSEGYAGAGMVRRRMRVATVVLGGTVPILLAGPLLAASIRGLGG